MNRVFVAIAPPPHIRERLALLRPALPGAKLVPPENLHLTLRFVGEVDNPTLDEVAASLDQVNKAPFELRCNGLGTFENRGKPSALWAGIDPSADLEGLRGRVEAAVRSAGLEPDHTKYSPHFTLARMRGTPVDMLVDYIQGHEPFTTESFTVDSFQLYRSFLKSGAPVYRVEAVYPLGVKPLDVDPMGLENDLIEEWAAEPAEERAEE